MTGRPGLRELMVRAVLDDAFRERALADPEGAFAEYDIGAEERAALTRRDGGALMLLGRLIEGPGAAAARPAGRPSGAGRSAGTDAAEAAPVAAPVAGPFTFRLLVHVLTSAEPSDGWETRLHCVSAMRALPEGVDAAAVPPPEPGAGALPGVLLEPAALELRVVPELSRDGAGGYRVAYHATMLDRSRRPAAPPAPPAEGSRALASAVRAAAPGERRALLERLMAELDAEGQGAPRGEEGGDG